MLYIRGRGDWSTAYWPDTVESTGILPTITPEQLYGSEEIIFNFIALDEHAVPENLRIIEDLQVSADLASLSQEYASQLQPTFR